MPAPLRLGMRSFLPVSAAVALLVAASLPAEARRHTRLTRSVPAADSVVRVAPRALQLWFNEAVPLPATRVRLTAGDGRVIGTAAPTRAAASDTLPVVVPIADALTDGRYTVDWVTASKDGHAVNGRFAFTLRRAP